MSGWMRRAGTGVRAGVGAGAVALALVLIPGVVGAPAAQAAPSACTVDVNRHHQSIDVQGRFGGSTCSDDWMSIDFWFAPEYVSGSVQDTVASLMRRGIEVRTSTRDLPWPFVIGEWGTERFGFRVSDGRLTGGVDLPDQEAVGLAISGDPAGTPASVTLKRRDLPQGARSIRDWNLGDGQCRIGGRTIDVTFNYRAEWPESQNIEEVADLQSVTITNDPVYGPLCLGLVLATPLPD